MLGVCTPFEYFDYGSIQSCMSPLTRKFDMAFFLNSTCDIELIDMRQGFQRESAMRQGNFLNLTCDMSIIKQQGHATLAFLKIDRPHEEPPSRALSMVY